MSEEETCKECDWLTETKFKRNGLDVYYCNCLGAKPFMEKTTNFKKCDKFKPKKRENRN